MDCILYTIVYRKIYADLKKFPEIAIAISGDDWVKVNYSNPSTHVLAQGILASV